MTRARTQLAFLVGVAVSIIPAAGCGSCAGKKVSPQELKQLLQDLTRMAKMAPGAVCRRPVLRGTPKAGSGTPILASLFDPKLAPKCVWAERIDHHLVRELLRAASVESFVNEYGDHRWVARSPLHPKTAHKDVTLFLKACRPAVERLEQAAAYGSVCSPFRPGVRGLPDELRQWPLITAVRFTAHRRARKGDYAGAFSLLLDGFRILQDLGRGGGSILQIVTTTVLSYQLSASVEMLLNTHRALPTALVARVERELAQLLKTEPQPHFWLPAAVLDFVLYDLLPKVLPNSYTPPGGWGSLKPEEARAGGNGGEEGVRIAALAMRPLISKAREVCAPGISLPDCHRRVIALAQQLSGSKDVSREHLTEVMESIERSGKQLRKRLTPYFQAVFLTGHAKYILTTAYRAFFLGALRLQARYRLLAERLKRCPPASAFEREPLVKLRTVQALGGRLRVERIGDGHLRLHWPQGVPKTDDMRPLLMVRCPY